MNAIHHHESQLEYSQAVVRIAKSATLAESPVRYNRLTMIACAGADQAIIDYEQGIKTTASQATIMLEPYLCESERNQLKEFEGIILVHNDLDHLDAIYAQAKRWGSSILFSTQATAYLLERNLSLPNDELYCWLSTAETDLDDQLIALPKQRNVGLMLNPDEDSRLVYAISQMIAYVGRVVPTNQIIHDGFTGITSLELADYLAGEYLSFWLKSVQKCYPFALFLGGEQAFVRYYDAIIEHEVREAVASFIHTGATLRDLDRLGNSISIAMARFQDQLHEALEIAIPSLESLAPANRKAGVVDCVTIGYSLFGEMRVVHVSL
ncbi:hypothetical protein PVA45_07805 (plasmid) [Entomospira entomophila]|uniref:Uncharacterized protein n=1 Tax=Entomospira entomophila TaxID=2719988 RepID=A0A968GD58_9SPIO|nr:hypothetical protein [Entomospira entomophilus]NIZ41408.1 hypothetical protein [Entomospira entomophilus]WDI36358.1 hypothetical protein PVA45_07805 [Entomospira entomophilus]